MRTGAHGVRWAHPAAAASVVPVECEDVMQVEPRPYGRRRELVLIGLIAVLGVVMTLLIVIPGALTA